VVSCDRGSARVGWADRRREWRRGYAESEACWASPAGGYGVFLVARRRLCGHERARRGTLAREQSPWRTRDPVVGERVARTESPPPPMAPMVAVPCHLDGTVVRSDVDRLLCGQWSAPSALARAPTNCVLDVAHSVRCPSHYLGAPASPAGPSMINRRGEVILDDAKLGDVLEM